MWLFSRPQLSRLAVIPLGRAIISDTIRRETIFARRTTKSATRFAPIRTVRIAASASLAASSDGDATSNKGNANKKSDQKNPQKPAIDNSGNNDNGEAAKIRDIKVTFVRKDGERIVVYGSEGESVMRLAQQNSIDIEGACEASLACCTCHVYVRDDFYEQLEHATEQEEDMLDMAPFLKSNSRLSCQVILSKKLDGIEVTLPPATRNFYVDDHKPSHH